MTRIRDSEIQDLEVGDIVYECESGLNFETRVLSKPESKRSDEHIQWSWIAENTQNGEQIHYLLTEGFSHYGPRLYREPQYFAIIEPPEG